MRTEYSNIAEYNAKSWDSAAYDADIIILSINRPNHTFAAIDSALRQELANVRIIVLDQGSSYENLSRLKAKVNGCPTMRLFTSVNNLGVGGGRNFLSSIGQGRIIVALDNDAVFADAYVVHKALKIFDEDAKLGALAFHILSSDGSQTDELSWGYPRRLRNRCNERFLTTTFVGAGHAIRRKAWDESGEYDADLNFTWEEYDFCLRAIAHKWDIMYDGTLRVYHDAASEERLHWPQGRQRLFVRNRLIIGRKWSQSWLSLTPRIIGYTINGAINKQLRPTLSGITEAIQHDKNMPRQQMTTHMRTYLLRHENQHRGSIYRRFREEILKPLKSRS